MSTKHIPVCDFCNQEKKSIDTLKGTFLIGMMIVCFDLCRECAGNLNVGKLLDHLKQIHPIAANQN